MSAGAPSYCERKDIHACTRQRRCTYKFCIGPCEGCSATRYTLRTSMLMTCAACNKTMKRYMVSINAATSERKRALALAAAASNPSLSGDTRFTDAELHLLAAACLRRHDVLPLFLCGSRSYVYVFQW
jgi:hypothetical protein